MNEIAVRYEKMIKEVETNPFYTRIDLNNRVNCYTCSSCGHIIKTKDIDRGVTPASIQCTMCTGRAWSSFYKDIRPDLEPTHEWYRPSLGETIDTEYLHPGSSDHIFNGGLHIRIIPKLKEAPQSYKDLNKPLDKTKEKKAYWKNGKLKYK